ncbi:MAG TPA: VWA domain-containing protein, partial [Candidatus Limnocylindria bacterium]|nr:VWA domain-containing protein [Candidatus Limnocylindria bacterium]
MSAKIGSATKMEAVKQELGAALGLYAGRLSFGLVAFGHRKASNCADSETLAKPGELTFAAKDKHLDKINPKGQAPVAA